MAFLDLPARVIERRLGGLARGVEPLRIVPLGFALIIGVVTVLFMLPVARTDGVGAPFTVALYANERNLRHRTLDGRSRELLVRLRRGGVDQPCPDRRAWHARRDYASPACARRSAFNRHATSCGR